MGDWLAFVRIRLPRSRTGPWPSYARGRPVALSRAANEIAAKLAASPSLRSALAAFNAAPAHAPAAQRPQVEAAVGAVNSGPLGANGVPATVTLPDGKTIPFNPLKDTAFHALSNAYAVGYLICSISALAAALIAGFFLAGRARHSHVADD